MKLQEGLHVAGRFLLVRQLGRGGMGSVWLAEHTELRISCALKFIEGTQADDTDYRARFTREARAAASLKSPHVVQILDSGEWEGLPYIAMELLEGESLSQRLRQRRRLAPAECAEIVGQIARALTKAHAAGIVHRDLKPDNVFLTHDDDRLLVKILDFGIAKVATTAEGDSTATGTMLGTPAYMSPEQAHGSKRVDHRSDLWSLAVVAYQCLIGEKPFKGRGVGELIMSVMSGPIPVPSAAAPDLPPGFDAWWSRAVSRAPEGRFQSARELSDQLAVALGLTPASGAPARAGAPRPSLPSGAELSPAFVTTGPRAGPGSALAEPGPLAEPALTAPSSHNETTRAVVTPGRMTRGRSVGAASSVVAAVVIAGATAGWFALRGDGSASASAPPSSGGRRESPAAVLPTVLAEPTAAPLDAPAPAVISAAPAEPAAPAPTVVPAAPLVPVPPSIEAPATAVPVAAPPAAPAPATAAAPAPARAPAAAVVATAKPAAPARRKRDMGF